MTHRHKQSLNTADESLSASVDDVDASASDMAELRQQYTLQQAENQLLWDKVTRCIAVALNIDACIQTSAIVLDE